MVMVHPGFQSMREQKSHCNEQIKFVVQRGFA